MGTNEEKPADLKIEYSKGKDFATAFATGVYGGISGAGKICMNFYVDRIPVPDVVSVKVRPDGGLDESGDPKEGLISVREVQSCVMMDLETARAFHGWLGGKVEDFTNALKKEAEKKSLEKQK
jgi:hypothetical protein